MTGACRAEGGYPKLIVVNPRSRIGYKVPGSVFRGAAWIWAVRPRKFFEAFSFRMGIIEKGYLNDLPTILEEALALPESDRSQFLDTVCQGQSALRQQIEGVIAAAAKANLFLAKS